MLGVQIGRTLVKNVFSVNGGGGQVILAVITESMSCLGECIWMCVKERPWKIQLGVCVRWGSSSYAQTYTPTEHRGEGFKYLLCNRLQEEIHCSSFKLQPLVLIEDQKC